MFGLRREGWKKRGEDQKNAREIRPSEDRSVGWHWWKGIQAGAPLLETISGLRQINSCNLKGTKDKSERPNYEYNYRCSCG